MKYPAENTWKTPIIWWSKLWFPLGFPVNSVVFPRFSHEFHGFPGFSHPFSHPNSPAVRHCLPRASAQKRRCQLWCPPWRSAGRRHPARRRDLESFGISWVDLYGNSWGYNGKCGNSQEFIGMNGDFHGEATPEDDCDPKWSHKTADV